MKRLLFVLILVGTGVVGLGFYLGWFTIGWDRAEGKGHLTGTLDEKKFQEDKKTALEKVHDLGHQAKEKAAGTTEEGGDPATPSGQSPPDQK